MTVQYNQYEQSKIDALEELDAARRRREDVNSHLYERVKKEAELAEANVHARARHRAELAAQEAAKRQAVEAAKQQAIQERIDTFKHQAQAWFPGTTAEFEAQWPSILAEWQKRQALGEADPELEHARAELHATGRYNIF